MQEAGGECFYVHTDLDQDLGDAQRMDDVVFAGFALLPAVGALSDPGAPVVLGNGRGRVSSFLTAAGSHNVRIECTEFDQATDVDASPGFLPGEAGEHPTANRTTRSDGKER